MHKMVKPLEEDGSQLIHTLSSKNLLFEPFHLKIYGSFLQRILVYE